MRWRRLKKILKEYPYLLDDSFKMSMSDAQNIIDEGNPMSFEEMIRAAMKRSDIPEDVWVQSVPALRRKLSQKRGLVIIASSVAAVILFFSVVPAGQAIAKKAFDMIVEYFKNETIVIYDDKTDNISISGYSEATVENHANSSEESLITDADDNVVEYKSIDAFYKDSGKNPIVLNNQGIILSDVSFDKEDQTLSQKYSSKKYGEILITQHWLSGNELVSIGKQEDYDHRPVLDGEHEVYYGVYEADNSFEGSIVLNDSYVLIGLNNCSDAEEIIDLLTFYK